MGRNQKEQELKGARADIQKWNDVFRHEAWKQLVRFLEMRYTDSLNEDVLTTDALSERIHRMKFIREIFGFIKYDFDLAQALDAELKYMRMDDEGIPEKESFI